jgi:predicted nuclease of predicted toxin-antitoxin system
MLVFIDENLPVASLRQIFEARGHAVRAVGEAFPAGSPDTAILAAAEEAGAVVVTGDKDWRNLIRRIRDDKERGQVRRAGRILLDCPHHIAIDRVRYLIETIEREYLIAEQEDRTLIMRITEGNFRVER